MILASRRERLVLDVLAATGGVRIPEPDLTGVESKSLEGWVMGMAMSMSCPHDGPYYLVNPISLKSPLAIFNSDPSCLAIAEDVNTAMEFDLVPWATIKAGEGVTGTAYGYFDEGRFAPTTHHPDWRWTSRPAISWAFEPATPTTAESLEATESTELVEAAQQIRETTKLPVQDLSAMLGIKRRQFYNWLDGTLPPTDRIRRLFALRDTVSRLSTAAAGDARRLRLALLAPIAGDSVFDAFAADDAERIRAAVDAAEDALTEGARLVRRVPPSARVHSSSGTAEEVRFERDALGLTHDFDAVSEEILEKLTSREREILRLLADGMSNVDVAEKLFINHETVKSHVRRILAKLKEAPRTHVVAAVLREAQAGLVDESDDQS